jgi:DNA-binding SARP family transcriptional activator/tetratricopeptide (TPR) repeat protein
MAYLHLDLLGGFSAQVEGRPCRLPTRKAQALLAYLAVPAGRFHARDKLTALLWGESDELHARQSFRQALAALRRVLGDQALIARSDTLALDAAAVRVDVDALEVDAGEERTAELYKGDFLDGLRVDEPRFEEWLVAERERLHALALERLAKLLRKQADAAPDAAIHTALRLLAIDPLQEPVHRTLMRLLLAQGRRAAALQQYQACVGWFERELGAEPEEATRALYREILRERAPAAPAGTTIAAPLTAGPAGEAPLIGRETEAAALAAALGRMLDQGGQVVLLRGEAGIGKSRLLREAAAEATRRGFAVSLGQCHQTEQILPLQPWIDALRGGRPALDVALATRLGAAATTHLSRVFPELAPASPPPASTGDQYALLFDALARLLAELTAERPLVLLLEDLHWADGMSARLLAFLARRIDRLPLTIVASMRPEELVDALVLAQALKELRPAPRVAELTLEPLSEPASRALIRALRPGQRPRDRLVGEIWQASEGNPFVIVESVRALREGTPKTTSGALAGGVRDFVAERLDRLGTVQQQVVAAGAVFGRDFSFPLLARAAQVGEAEAAGLVEELVRRRILTTVGDRLDFSHDWIRLVAYERLLPPRRAALHAAVGEALEVTHAAALDEVADQLGHHYSRAGDAAKAVPHLIHFANLASQRYALDDALRALDQAIAVVASLPAPERDRRTLDLVLRQAFVLSILGRQHEIAERLQARAEQVARVNDPLLISEYHFRLGLTYFFLGERGRGQRAAEQALSEGERANDGVAIGKALHVLSLSAFEAGKPREGIAHAQRGIPLLDLPHMQPWHGLLLHDLALNCLVLGDLDAGLAAARREDAVGIACGWPRVRALAGYAISWGLALRGECVEAIEHAEATLALSRDPTVASLVSGALGFAHMEKGDAGAAVPILAEVVDRLRKSPVRSGEIRHLALLGEAHCLAGNLTAARTTAAQALELSQADGMGFHIGLAQRALGRIAAAEGDLTAAEQYLADALATFHGCDAGFEAARIHALLAELCAQRQQRDAARAHLAAALAVFDAAAPPRAAAMRSSSVATAS